ncbi:MAG: helix-turn-helix transcriptional regulator [Niastella sp.]|nr:helix-turn-helix transcriptional regulator [Niastella sp.]
MHASIKIRNADLIKFDLVKRLIAEDIKQHHTISFLASYAGLNEFKLKVGFKLLYGSTIYEFLLNLRMKQAFHLLSRTDHSIQEIAEQCGYGYATNFIAVFRKKFKIKPTQYRRINAINTTLWPTIAQPCFTDTSIKTIQLQPVSWYQKTV